MPIKLSLAMLARKGGMLQRQLNENIDKLTLNLGMSKSAPNETS